MILLIDILMLGIDFLILDRTFWDPFDMLSSGWHMANWRLVVVYLSNQILSGEVLSMYTADCTRSCDKNNHNLILCDTSGRPGSNVLKKGRNSQKKSLKIKFEKTLEPW